MAEDKYNLFLKVHQSLMDAEVPVDRRVMYYKVISWWRHPIKRYKQKKQIRSLLETN